MNGHEEFMNALKQNCKHGICPSLMQCHSCELEQKLEAQQKEIEEFEDEFSDICTNIENAYVRICNLEKQRDIERINTLEENYQGCAHELNFLLEERNKGIERIKKLEEMMASEMLTSIRNRDRIENLEKLESKFSEFDSHIDDLLARVGQIDIKLSQQNPVPDLSQCFHKEGCQGCNATTNDLLKPTNVSTNATTNDLPKSTKSVAKKTKTLWLAVDPTEERSYGFTRHHVTEARLTEQEIDVVIKNYPYLRKVKIEIEVDDENTPQS